MGVRGHSNLTFALQAKGFQQIITEYTYICLVDTLLFTVG